MTAETDIQVMLTDDQQIAVDHDRILDVAMRTARSEGARGEISITLVDENRMADLHQQYMNEPGATDVLSFPIDGLLPLPVDPPGEAPVREDLQDRDPPPVMIGEVVVCPAVARVAGPDLLSELDLLVAHGVLHLLGHDHDDADSAGRMRASEKRLTGRSGARAT